MSACLQKQFCNSEKYCLVCFWKFLGLAIAPTKMAHLSEQYLFHIVRFQVHTIVEANRGYVKIIASWRVMGYVSNSQWNIPKKARIG